MSAGAIFDRDDEKVNTFLQKINVNIDLVHSLAIRLEISSNGLPGLTFMRAESRCGKRRDSDVVLVRRIATKDLGFEAG